MPLFRRPVFTALGICLIGVALAAGGLQLVMLGGVPYYLIAGMGLIASGVLIGLGRRSGLGVYAAVFVGTWIWALAEAGLDGWKLMPRLLAPAVLGLWLCMPWVAGKLQEGKSPVLTSYALPWAGAIACLLTILAVVGLGFATTAARWQRPGQVATALPARQPNPALPAGEWRWYGRDAQGTRFSPLIQITPENVRKLQVAWTFHTGDLPQAGENSHGHEFNFEVTPIKVGDSVFACTPHRDVVALDPVTGAQKWRFHPAQGSTKPNIYLACRGVAYYDAPAGHPCPHRIVSTTGDARIFALDAATGQICPSFGQGGYVDLRQGMGDVPPGFHFISSQPMIMHDRIMLSGWVYDNQTEGEPSGVIRAFNAIDGRLSWAWDLGRSDPTSPLKPGEIYTRGTPNGWGAFTADPALGLVYVPLGNATPDYWGAHRRPFDEKYSTSIVALEIDTGKERWHFQTVHHDVWDFDVPIAGSLLDIPDGHGGSAPALVQTTKMGELFLLDRRDGHPLAEVRERPVPQQGLPGDRLSSTQPQSVGMPDLSPQDIKARDTWGATPIDQLLCRIQLQKLRYNGQFTPPTLQGSIAYPAFDGVIDWQGATVDPTRHLLIANTSYIPFTVTAHPQAEAIQKKMIKPWAGWNSGQPYPEPPEFANGPEFGTPYEVTVKPWLNSLGAPCIAPPWGKMVAIDLATRKIVWERPVGTTRDMGLFKTHLNVPLTTGIFNIGGNIVSGSGLIFAGAYADDYLRAFDERSGKMLWQSRLPAGGQATPMTYSGADGRQYVLIAAGGHGGLGTKNGDALIAFALPKQ